MAHAFLPNKFIFRPLRGHTDIRQAKVISNE